MAKILVLGETGFGKTSSICPIPAVGITGLDPAETFIISATSKPLPFKGSKSIYKETTLDKLKMGKRVITTNGKSIAQIISTIGGSPKSPFKNIVLDDANYIMQDYYMENAMRKGYDIFKEIGGMMNSIFNAAENLPSDVNFIMLAHYEEYKTNSVEGISYRFKTVGKMVQDYITPEGKFDIVLYGKQYFDEKDQKVKKEFITNYDGQFPAKSPVGMFDIQNIPNDLGLVVKKVNEYYG